MTAAAGTSGPDAGRPLIERLPRVRGRLTPDAPLASFTWFRCGGPAEVLLRPADEADLAEFLTGCPADVPVSILGVASNTLVRDGGVPGIVIRLGREFAGISVEGETVRAGAAAMDINVARAARDAGLAGLEFLVGIPGSIGGALRMNAGAYGAETRDVLVEAVVLDRRGRRHVLTPAAMGMAYRHSDVAPDWVFAEGLFRARPGDREAIGARMDEINAARTGTQPIRSRTGGSTFANPPGAKAWKLIDEAGCRGLRVGGAQVSEMHCNFLINTGGATGADLESLGEEVRRRVREQSGIELRWEIKRIGVPLGDPAARTAAAAEAGEPGDA